MKGWMLSYKNDDPYRNFSRSYMKEETAYKDASTAIEGWAKEEIENIGGEEERQYETETLRTVLELIGKGKHKEAYEEWRGYADDTEPGEDVLAEETEIVEE